MDDEQTKRRVPFALKFMIGFLTILTAFMAILTYMAVAYNNALADAAPFTPPASGLSQSVFVQQNSSYVSSDTYSLEYNFANIPYRCDVPDWSRVTMGSGMVFVDSSSTKFIHVTDTSVSNINTALNNELSYCMMYNADTSKTEFVTRTSDKGYYNGYETVYSAQEMTVYNSDGTSSRTFYLLSYAIPVQNTDRCALFTVAFVTPKNASSNMTFLKNWVLTYRQQEVSTEETEEY